MLNCYRLNAVQVLFAPGRKDPVSEIDQVGAPGLLGFVLRQQLGLAVVLDQAFERHQCRTWKITVNVRSQELDSV